VPAPDVARTHQAARQVLVTAAAAEAARRWSQVNAQAIAESWARGSAALAAQLAAVQLAAAQQADPYLVAVMAAQDAVVPAAAGVVAAEAFAGLASDGRDLLTLLYQPAVAALTAIRDGAVADDALRVAAAGLDAIVRTQVADAGRVADQVALVARGVDGYVRLVVGRSCSRCIILAGRVYEWSDGFERHPNCVPAGTLVSGPRRLATTRRWYEGKLAVIATAAGEQLAVTGNHPVLTDRGWLPAYLVQEGDHVVRSTRCEGAVPLVVPHEHEMPARVEDLWRADGVVALRQMPTAAEDFHGDGGHGQVDVVLADGLLRDGVVAALGEPGRELALAGRVKGSARLVRARPGEELLHRLFGAADSVVGGRGLCPASFRGHLGSAGQAGGGHVSDGHAGGNEVSPDDVAADAVAQAEGILALASRVRRGQVLNGQGVLAARWDAPAGPFTVQSRRAYAERGQDLLPRLTGQVALDRVVENRRVAWSGHVYNLTSAEGWFVASGLIVSNCDCIHIPVAAAEAAGIVQDPMVVYNAMTPEERTKAGWSRAEQQAIKDGASISAVTNVHRGGVYVAGGRRFTHEGGTRRRPRITPEQIYRDAGGDRDEAIRLLRLHGYIR
jgi:hypothetical protein